MKFWFEVDNATVSELTWTLAENNGYVNLDGMKYEEIGNEECIYQAFDTENDKAWGCGRNIRFDMSKYGKKISVEEAIEILSKKYNGSTFELNGYKVMFKTDKVHIGCQTVSYEDACKLITQWRKFRKNG